MRQTVLLLVLSAGCAGAPVKSAAPDWQLLGATPGTEEITFRGEIRLRRAAITQTGAVGPDLDLKRSATAIEGTTRSQPVSLHTREDGMEGNVSGNDFGVSLSRDGAATRVTGIVGAQPSTFWLSRSTLRGTIGQCDYQTGWSGGMYAGTRNCGARLEQIALEFPAALQTWTNAQVAALIGIFLTGVPAREGAGL